MTTDREDRFDPEGEERDEAFDELEDSGIIELTDEDGVTERFEYLTTISYQDKLYVVLMLLDEEEEESEDGEVIILEIQQDENGEDMYVNVEDSDISDAVFQEFLRMVEEEGEDE